MSDELDSTSDTTSDGSDIIYQVAKVVAAVALQAPALPPPLPFTITTGLQWVHSNLSHMDTCKSNLHMSPHAFMTLHNLLVEYHGLMASQDVTTLEALGMYVFACAGGMNIVRVKDRFARTQPL